MVKGLKLKVKFKSMVEFISWRDFNLVWLKTNEKHKGNYSALKNKHFTRSMEAKLRDKEQRRVEKIRNKYCYRKENSHGMTRTMYYD